MTDPVEFEEFDDDDVEELEPDCPSLPTAHYESECPACGELQEVEVVYEESAEGNKDEVVDKRAGVCTACIGEDSSMCVYIADEDRLEWFRRDIETDDLCDNFKTELFDWECPGSGATHTISFDGGEHEVCEACQEALVDFEIDHEVVGENDEWWPQYTDAHNELCNTILTELDVVDCYHNQHELGEIFIHTQYLDSYIVRDLCTEFGFEVYASKIERPDTEHSWDCVDEDGPKFEINLDISEGFVTPLRGEVIYDARLNHDDRLDSF